MTDYNLLFHFLCTSIYIVKACKISRQTDSSLLISMDFFPAVKNSKTSPDYKERMEASVKDYLDENGLEDMAALAKKYDVSKSSIQRYLSSCNKFMPNV